MAGWFAEPNPNMGNFPIRDKDLGPYLHSDFSVSLQRISRGDEWVFRCFYIPKSQAATYNILKS
jgi:hypothetical protein